MTKMFYKYKEIKDWEILETRIIHAFNEVETPIEIIKIYIGEVEQYIINNLGWRCKKEIFPIIRWITREEYDRLKSNEGIIVW